MEQYMVHRPREEALRRILDRHPYDAVGMIFRLAWLAGLLRNEIVSLRWDDVTRIDPTAPISREEAADLLCAVLERTGILPA